MTNNQPEPKQKQGQYFFFGIFVILAVATFLLIRPFLGVVAVAFISVVMLQPVYSFFLRHEWVHGRVRLASGLTILLFLSVIILPLTLLALITIGQVQSIIEWATAADNQAAFHEFAASVEDGLERIPVLRNLQFDEEGLVTLLRTLASGALLWLTNLLINLGKSLPSIFAQVIIFVAILVSLLPSYKNLIHRLQELSPLEIDISERYVRKSTAMISSMVKGIFLLAVIQGLIMGGFYWLADIPFTFILCLLSIVFAILPAIGISFIVLPLAIIALFTGNTVSALIILFGFYVVVNPLDVILRPRLVSKEAYLNFAIILLAIFGGLYMAGILGLIFGPVIMLLFMTTIDIYAENYGVHRSAATSTIRAEK